MKKVFALAVVVVLALFSTAAFAGTAHDNTGCGLGTMMWQNGADGSVVSQSLQATTNGTLGSQTFGITTGTSDCKSPANFVSNERLKEFVIANMDNLAKEIAMGRGEKLETLAELMNVSVPDRTRFYVKLQGNFSKIFPSDRVEASDVVDGIVAAYSEV